MTLNSHSHKRLLLFFFIFLGLSSCAPENYTSHEYGFFGGIVHGFCLPFAIIGKLFGADIGLYAENNTGFLYWLGFIFGLGGLGTGSRSSY